MKRVILFGAGYYLAYRINQLLDCSGVEILYILDNDEFKDGTYFRGIPVKYYRAVIDCNIYYEKMKDHYNNIILKSNGDAEQINDSIL